MEAGTVLAVVTLVLGGLGVFWRTSAKTARVEDVASIAHASAKSAHARLDSHAIELALLKTADAVNDERWGHVLRRLDSIDTKLDSRP